MKKLAFALAALSTALAGCQDAGTGPADPTDGVDGHQPGTSHDPAMTHDPGMTHPGGAGQAPYASLAATSYPGLSEQEVASLRDGAGAGLALPAEINGYPGPKHVLELADGLGLTIDQRDRVQALYNATNADARRAGQRVLDAYAAMEGAFRDGTIAQDRLANLTGAHAAGLGDLRRVQLAAHLETLDILTPHQIATYGELRGYGPADHGAHEH